LYCCPGELGTTIELIDLMFTTEISKDRPLLWLFRR